MAIKRFIVDSCESKDTVAQERTISKHISTVHGTRIRSMHGIAPFYDRRKPVRVAVVRFPTSWMLEFTNSNFSFELQC